MTQSVTVTTARIRSYYGTTGGQLIVDSLPLRDRIEGRDVLIVEDILDSGATCELFSRKLMDLGALSVKICSLLDKPSRRIKNVKADILSAIQVPRHLRCRLVAWTTMVPTATCGMSTCSTNSRKRGG